MAAPHYLAKALPLLDKDGRQLSTLNHGQGFDTVAVFDTDRGGPPVAS